MLPYSQPTAMKSRARKSLGQHFLVDSNYCNKIVHFARIRSEDIVVEIGAGTGNLTQVLLQKAKQVIAIELDRALVELLESRWSAKHDHASETLRIIQADILSWDWSILSQNRVKVIGNLPYNIATRIIGRLTEVKGWIDSCTLMVQKEVANRISAQPATKNYGFFTLLLQYHFKCIPGFDIPPRVFAPRPKVMSHVVKLIPQPPPSQVPDYGAFLELLKNAFQQRRKTLWNNLKQQHEASRLREAFAACDIELRDRAENLTFQQYACLTRFLCRQS